MSSSNADIIQVLENSDQPGRTAMVEVASTRAAQETQAAMVIAKRFPRDQTAAFSRILKACKRKSLAESAMYVYPRGNSQVTGPTIRLAEVMAQNWGNIDFGMIELEQKYGESTMMAYAWDLETNCRQTKVFTVKHERYTKQGSYRLSDPRDIYEMTANQGARRMRACILGVIPGDFVDDAIAECEKTMRGENNEPLSDRVRKMVSSFGEYNVTQEMIERRLGHIIKATIEVELVQLRKMYLSIKDNMASIHDFFPPVDEDDPTKPKSERLADDIDKMFETKKSKKEKKSSKKDKGKQPDAPQAIDSEGPTEPQKSAFELFTSDMENAPDLEALTEVKNRALAESQMPNGLPMDDWKRLTVLFSELKKSFEDSSTGAA